MLYRDAKGTYAGGGSPGRSAAGGPASPSSSGQAVIIDKQPLAQLFVFCALWYLFAYATEAPIRYVLYLAGADNMILARDALIIGPLVLLFVARALRLNAQPLFLTVGILFLFHSIVLLGTIGSFKGAAYGVKILINLLFGFLVAGSLIAPGRRTFRVLAAIWLLTLIGILLDKFVVTFPWTGIKTIVGDLNVDVSKDWMVQDTLAKRVAGFTRSSICVAVFMPPLTMVLLSRVRHWLLRGFILAIAMGAVFITTQKGAIVAFAPVAAILCLPPAWRLGLLKFACLGFMALAIVLPLLTFGLRMEHGTGVFSTESIFLRIVYTWPQAWDWINRHQMLVFGVGLGGIGGPQRFYAPDNFNPADNVFILMYAYFGVFALAYLLAVAILVTRRTTGDKQKAVTATAVLAFAFGYGAVLSMLEDQSAPLFIGAALGVLWRESRRAVPDAKRADARSAPLSRYRLWQTAVMRPRHASFAAE
jgi:hypothetical protein